MTGTTPRVVIIVPVLNRPERAAPLVESVKAATPDPYRLVFVGTGEGDVAELRAVNATGAELLILPGRRQKGDYARKINYAYENTSEPVLFLAADDLDFKPGWLPAAMAKISEGYAVVGTNDLGNERVMAGHHSTHTFVTRKYVDEYGTIDEPGKVLHEGYNHWYVDDEFIQTARHRDVWSPCLDSHVEHLHYAWKKGKRDKTIKLGEGGIRPGYRDSARFYDRCQLWGGVPPPPKPKVVPDPETGIVTAEIGK